MQMMRLVMASSMTTARVGTVMNRATFGITSIHILTTTMHWVMTAVHIMTTMSESTMGIRRHWSVHIRLMLYVFSCSAIWGAFLRDCAHSAIFIAAIHIMSRNMAAFSVPTVRIAAMHIMAPIMHRMMRMMTAMTIATMRITALW